MWTTTIKIINFLHSYPTLFSPLMFDLFIFLFYSALCSFRLAMHLERSGYQWLMRLVFFCSLSFFIIIMIVMSDGWKLSKLSMWGRTFLLYLKQLELIVTTFSFLSWDTNNGNWYIYWYTGAHPFISHFLPFSI